MNFNSKKNLREYKVYVHVNKINGKPYVGITKQATKKRWRNGEGYSTQKKFYNAIKKYGWKNFLHATIASGLTHDEACKLEQYYIEQYNSIKNGYNVALGGEGASGVPCTEEHRHKISEANKGKNNFWYGKHLSTKQKNIISESNSVTVAAYDDEGNLYKVFNNSVVAAKELGLKSHSSIGNAMDKNTKAGGYRWLKYDYNNPIYKIPPFNGYASRKHFRLNNANAKRVNQYSLEGKYLKTFECLVDACNETGIRSTTLTSGIKRGHLIKGFQWRYYDDVNNYEDISPYKRNGSNAVCIKKDGIIQTICRSVRQAAKITGIPRHQIIKALEKENGIIEEYHFTYIE